MYPRSRLHWRPVSRITSRATAVLLAMLAVAASGRPAGAGDAFTLTGHVEFEDGSPAPGAFVSINGLDVAVHVDETGAFEISGPAGRVETLVLDAVSRRDEISQVASLELDGATTQGTIDVGLVSLAPTCDGPVVTFEGEFLPGRIYALDREYDTVVAVGREESDDEVFRVFDIADPASPVLVSTMPVDGYVDDVILEGAVAYFTESGAGVHVVDWAALPMPISLSIAPTGPTPGRLVLLDATHLLVSDWNMGLSVVDASDPTAPIVYQSPLVGAYGEYIGYHAVRDGLAFLATASGLEIYDPLSTLILGSLALPGDEPATSVTLDDDLAYITSKAGLAIADVADLAAPVMISWSPLLMSEDADVENGLAYLVGSTFAGGYLMIVDVSDPMTPVLRSLLEAGYHHRASLQVSGGRALVAALSRDFMFADLRDPIGNGIAGFIEMPSNLKPTALVDGILAGPTRYYPGMAFVDVSDIRAPVLKSWVMTGDYKNDIEIHGGNAFVAGDGGVQIFDVTDPTSPSELAYITTGSRTGQVDVHGDLAYLAANQLRIYDVSDPSNPGLISSFGVGGVANDLKIKDGVAYVSTGLDLAIVDVENPWLPHLIGERPGSSASVDVLDETLLVGDELGYTDVYDVSEPANPSFLTSMEFIGDLSVSGNRVASTRSLGRLEIFDLSDPMEPVLVESIPGWGYLYVAGALLTRENLYIGTGTGSGAARFALQINDFMCRGDDIGGTVSVPGQSLEPFRLEVFGANPFRSGVEMEIVLGSTMRLHAGIYGVSGRLVWSESATLAAGRHRFRWDGRSSAGESAPPGVYFIRVESPIGDVTQKLTLVR